MRYSFNHSCYSSLCWRNSAEILPKFCRNSNRNRDTYFQDNMSFRFEVNSWNVWNIPSWQCITHREITYYAHAHGLFLWKSLSSFFACVHFSAFPESKHHHITHQMILNLEELSLGIDYVENLIRTMNAWNCTLLGWLMNSWNSNRMNAVLIVWSWHVTISSFKYTWLTSVTLR